MNKVSGVVGLLCASAALSLTAMGGSEALSSGKEMKQVESLPPPPLCDWAGFYLGLNSGGQFGHSETFDSATGRRFGYDESGFTGGLQFGYNFQWRWLVIGPEIDAGYMNVDGSGDEPKFVGQVHANTESDFFTTLRGRAGVRLNQGGCWLIYATGGAIGVNYTARFHVDPDFFDARDNEFDWGYTVGGGVERMLTRHWSIKAEYLYYRVDGPSFGNTQSGVTANFDAETTGHIIRAGLNYKF
ncbi:MAG: outer rane immunogenic protein [Verrucomicrobiota bacterium]